MEQDLSIENNIELNQTSAEYKSYITQAERSNWIKKTGNINLDKDGNRLWKLARAMNEEKSASAPVVIEQNQQLWSGKQVADHFMNNFQKVSDVEVPEDKEKEVREDQKQF